MSILPSRRNWLTSRANSTTTSGCGSRPPVDDGPLVEPAVADQPLHQAHPRRAPEPVALLVARRLGDLPRVEPVEEGLLADLQLVSHLEGGEVLHRRASIARSFLRLRRREQNPRCRRPVSGIGGAGARSFPLGMGPARVSRNESFEAEALPHLRSLYGTAYRLTRNAHDAEDLVQETFLRAYRSFDRYTPGTNIRAWLYTILHRTRADALRRRGRSPETVELEGDGPAVAGAQDRGLRGTRHRARPCGRSPRSFAPPWSCVTSRNSATRRSPRSWTYPSAR